MHIVRIGKVFNRKNTAKGIDQKGIFDIARAKGYRDFLLRDPADPNIPGTNILRLRPVHLGGKSVGISSDEIQRVVLALQDLYAKKAADRASAGKKNNPPQALGQAER
jgi:hypothetical protein